MANLIKITSVCQKVFGITYQRYMQLAKDGVLPPPERGMIDFVASARAVIEYYRKMAHTQGNLSLSDERMRLTRLRADRESLRVDREKGELIDRGTAEEWVSALVSDARISFQAVPRRAAGQFPGPGKELELWLRAEIYSILRKLAGEKKRKGGNDE